MSDRKGFWELMQEAGEEEFKKLNVAKGGAELIGFSRVKGDFYLIYMTPGDHRSKETIWKNARDISEKLLQK